MEQIVHKVSKSELFDQFRKKVLADLNGENDLKFRWSLANVRTMVITESGEMYAETMETIEDGFYLAWVGIDAHAPHYGGPISFVYWWERLDKSEPSPDYIRGYVEGVHNSCPEGLADDIWGPLILISVENGRLDSMREVVLFGEEGPLEERCELID